MNFFRWVILRRADRNAMILENFTLRSRLNEANADLRRRNFMINTLAQENTIRENEERARA